MSNHVFVMNTPMVMCASVCGTVVRENSCGFAVLNRAECLTIFRYTDPRAKSRFIVLIGFHCLTFLSHGRLRDCVSTAVQHETVSHMLHRRVYHYFTLSHPTQYRRVNAAKIPHTQKRHNRPVFDAPHHLGLWFGPSHKMHL